MSRLPRLAAAAAVVAAAGTGVWLARSSSDTPVPAVDGREVTLASWQSPTDFLLDTPGVELLRTTPDIRESTTSAASVLTSTSAKGATP